VLTRNVLAYLKKFRRTRMRKTQINIRYFISKTCPQQDGQQEWKQLMSLLRKPTICVKHWKTIHAFERRPKRWKTIHAFFLTPKQRSMDLCSGSCCYYVYSSTGIWHENLFFYWKSSQMNSSQLTSTLSMLYSQRHILDRLQEIRNDVKFQRILSETKTVFMLR